MNPTMSPQTMLQYDDSLLSGRLDCLAPNLAAAFAACIAERLFPGFVSYAINTESVSTYDTIDTLDMVWRSCAGARLDEAEASRLLDECMDLIASIYKAPEGDAYYAEGAIAAIACAIRALTLSPRDAGRAAQCGYEVVDYFITEECKINFAAQGDDGVVIHPAVQRELMRQQRDLQDLEQISRHRSDFAVLIEKLRKRARADGASVFSND